MAATLADIHNEVTWVPRELVEVVFVEYAPTSAFGGRPLGEAVVTITVRAGRDRGTNADLVAPIAAAWQVLTGQRDVLVELIEIDTALTCVSIGDATPRTRTEPSRVRHRSVPVGFERTWYPASRSAGVSGGPSCTGRSAPWG
ncbi:hypothetical protein [Nocardia stercoris]|nr:hypothetical protein [Nocardia stercoris]